MQKELEELKIEIKDYENDIRQKQNTATAFYNIINDLIFDGNFLKDKNEKAELKLLDWDLEISIYNHYIETIIDYLNKSTDVTKAAEMINTKRINKHLQNICIEYDKLISEVKEIIYKEKI